jgi:hypothetical protein
MSSSRPGARAARARDSSRAAAALTAALTAVVLAVSACTSSGPSATSTSAADTAPGEGGGSGPIVPTASTLHWHACSGELGLLRVPDCTMLSVPLNYADPGGRHISLALDMIPATAPPSRQQGILLVNPGGPGASGLTLALAAAERLSPGVSAE